MLKEEVMDLKEKLQNSDYDSFHASDGWLDGWKASYVIRERRIVGEADVIMDDIRSHGSGANPSKPKAIQ